MMNMAWRVLHPHLLYQHSMNNKFLTPIFLQKAKNTTAFTVRNQERRSLTLILFTIVCDADLGAIFPWNCPLIITCD